MLTPLKQFICDECGQVINSPEDGYVEWESGQDEEGNHFERGFRIVHHLPKSPYKETKRDGCYIYGKSHYRSDISLSWFLDHVHQELFSWLDLGFLHDSTGNIGNRVVNFKEYADFARRLTIPYYEEARLYFQNVLTDSDFTDNNEISIFNENTLKSIINKYAAP